MARGNQPCRAARIRGVLLAAATMTAVFADLAHSGAAQPEAGGDEGKNAQAVDLDPAPPPPRVAMRMYQDVDDWVRAWRTPMDPSGMPNLPAASVTLRFQGEMVGRGTVIAENPEGAPGVLMIAAKLAMDETKKRLPIPRDALFDEALMAAGKEIVVGVEVAGRPVPLRIDTYAGAVDAVAPGLEGVAVRMGERIEAMFPETMLVTGTDAAGAARALVSKASGDPTLGLKEPKALREEHGTVFYRFNVTHLGQVRPGGPPEFLHRGGREVRMDEMTEAELRAWAGELARHIMMRRPDPAAEARGAVDFEPGAGAALEDALDALALVQYSETVIGDAAGFRLVRDVATSRLARLARSAGQPDAAADSIAWVALRALAVEKDVPATSEPATLDEALKAYFRHCEETIGKGVGAIESVQPGTRSVVAWAAARRQVSRRESAPEVGRLIRGLFRDAPPERLAAMMPWLGWAELSWSRLGRGEDEQGEVPAAPALREMRERIWKHQLRTEELAAEARDMAGGIVFTATRQPLPTWQAARPMAFVATMLGDPRLTEDQELPREITRLLLSLRFLRQLTADEAECRMHKDAARARGGVRASLFDQRMPPEATAMTLLAVCETIRSLEAIKARQIEGAASKTGR